MKKVNNKESGNVLFLILIAVALFAALSYAVTSSTRSGGGSTEREQSLLGSAALTQYPTALRTAVIRMILSGNDVRNLLFNGPSAFGTLTTTQLVFHPEGGGAVHQQSPSDVMASGSAVDWSHNANFNVPSIGRDSTGGNDLIAFVVGINQSTCKRINDEMGIPSSGGACGGYKDEVPIVVITDDANLTENMDDDYEFLGSPIEAIQCAGGATSAYTGKATGCFFDATIQSSGRFVFYSVILER